MGVAAHAVLRTLLDYDAARFAGMRVRFTAPALPGDTLRTELWVDGNVGVAAHDRARARRGRAQQRARRPALSD